MKRASRRAKPVRPTAAMVIGDALLLALSLTGVFLFQYNVYGLPGSRSVVLCACLTAAALSLAVFSLPKYRWAAVLGLTALGLVLLWRYWDSVFQGAQAVYSTAAHVITEATEFPGEFPIPKQWTQSEIRAASNHFLTAIIFALALPLGWAVVRRRTFFPVLLLTLPWLIPIFLAEFLPDVVSLSMVAACWLTMLLTGLTSRKDRAGGARLTLAALPAALLALCCICLIFPAEDYVYPDWAAAAAQRIFQAGEQMENPFTAGSLFASDAPQTIDLSGAGPRQYTGRSVLRVESDWSGRAYLRGAAYASYTGDSWERLSDAFQEELEEIWQENALVSPLGGRYRTYTYSAVITHLNGAARMAYYLYQPTNLPETLGGVSCAADSYLRLEEPRKEYTVTFSSPDDMDRVIGDEVYRQFVYKHYLDVPEELSGVLWDWWQEEGQQRQSGGVPTSGFYQITAAQSFADTLAAITEYDLETPVTPEGEDFVAWFLTESHRGYCVHYASAVTMLLRMCGIPARYVSGYTAEITDGKAMVPDSAAHAWVEVYVDSYGWYPVEVTPAAAFADPADEKEPAAEATPAAEPTPSPAPSATPVQSESPAAQPSEKPDRTEREEAETAAREPLDLSWIWYAAAVLAVLGSPILARALRRKKWNRLTTLPDNNRAVLEIYGWYHKLPPWGGKPDQRLEELARKARFSQHILTGEERREALAILRQEIARLSAAPSWKRPLFRYLFTWK